MQDLSTAGLRRATSQAGVLYKIANGDAGVMTAEQALQHTSQYIYRYDDPVWLWNQGSNLINTATGNVSVSSLGTVGAGATRLLRPGDDFFHPDRGVPGRLRR